MFLQRELQKDLPVFEIVAWVFSFKMQAMYLVTTIETCLLKQGISHSGLTKYFNESEGIICSFCLFTGLGMEVAYSFLLNWWQGHILHTT
jgi:hypothetical protein